MTKRYILFDLDGTITDSSEGITKSVQHALKKLGIEENDQAMLRRFIGPPLDAVSYTHLTLPTKA